MAVKRPTSEYLVLTAIILVITVIALPTLTYPLGRDQGEFATIGRGILDGRVPYVDLWNPKPPAVFYVYAGAISLFGRTPEAIRIIDLLIYPSIAVALYWIGRRISSGRVGLWAALLFGVFYFSETFWTLAQNDGIVLLPMLLAMLCALKATDETPRSALWAFCAGALAAYAIWFKYPFALFIGVLVFAYVWMRHRSHSPLRARDIGAFAVGGLLVGAGGIACMVSIGAWDALVESARVTASYTVLGLSDVAESFSTALGFRIQLWGALFLMALVGLFFGVRRFNRNSLWWVVAVWLLAGAAMMLVQLKFYDYHWLPMLPPLVLAGAGAIEAVIGRVSEPRARVILRGVVAFIGFAALASVIWSRTLPYLTGQEDQVAYFSRFQAGEFVASESLEVANYLRERVVPTDSLFIWGFRPEVYYMSQLNPAGRFIFQFPLVARWYPPKWKEQTVDTLWAALPPYVLVLQADYMPWVTGTDEDSNTLLQAYTELNNWLEFNYERETQIGSFFLWRRISAPR